MAAKSKGQPNQVEKFKELARDLECNDSEPAFEAKVRRIAKPKPKDKRPTK